MHIPNRSRPRRRRLKRRKSRGCFSRLVNCVSGCLNYMQVLFHVSLALDINYNRWSGLSGSKWRDKLKCMNSRVTVPNYNLGYHISPSSAPLSTTAQPQREFHHHPAITLLTSPHQHQHHARNPPFPATGPSRYGEPDQSHQKPCARTGPAPPALSRGPFARIADAEDGRGERVEASGEAAGTGGDGTETGGERDAKGGDGER